jgi:hypothetical protein
LFDREATRGYENSGSEPIPLKMDTPFEVVLRKR